MKTWILSSDSEIPSTKRLLTVLKQAKFETEVLNPLELQFEFGHKGAFVFHRGKARQMPDLVLPRLGWNSLNYGLRVARFFETAGVRVLNSAESLERASDKMLSLQIFHQARLPVPQTRQAHGTASSEHHLFPDEKSHVFKTLQGSQGFGVMWQLDRRQSLAQMDLLRTAGVATLTQELIESSFGADVRAFVIDGRVVASMKRKGPTKDLRSNLHQKGRAAKIRLSALEESLVLAAVKSLGLFYAGVDFLQTKKGPLLLEANPSPGFEGISKTSGNDIARELVNVLRTKAPR